MTKVIMKMKFCLFSTDKIYIEHEKYNNKLHKRRSTYRRYYVWTFTKFNYLLCFGIPHIIGDSCVGCRWLFKTK